MTAALSKALEREDDDDSFADEGDEDEGWTPETDFVPPWEKDEDRMMSSSMLLRIKVNDSQTT